MINWFCGLFRFRFAYQDGQFDFYVGFFWIALVVLLFIKGCAD